MGCCQCFLSFNHCVVLDQSVIPGFHVTSSNTCGSTQNQNTLKFQVGKEKGIDLAPHNMHISNDLSLLLIEIHFMYILENNAYVLVSCHI